MCEAGDVSFADVVKDESGVCEFVQYFMSSYRTYSQTPDPSLKTSAKQTSPASRIWSFKSCQFPVYIGFFIFIEYRINHRLYGFKHSWYVFWISGLPQTGSWQDLKDHMREAGDVCFADVFKDGSGVCEYVRYEDMKYALKKLDDSKFRSHEVSHIQTYS